MKITIEILDEDRELTQQDKRFKERLFNYIRSLLLRKFCIDPKILKIEVE